MSNDMRAEIIKICSSSLISNLTVAPPMEYICYALNGIRRRY